MKTLRIIGAAFLVLLGAMMLVSWNVAGKAVSAIESGEAATNLTQKLLDDPNFADAAAQRIADGLVERTQGNLIGRIVAAFEPEIKQAIVRVLESDQVNAAVTKSVSQVEKQLTDELTDPNRPSGPFTVSIDLSDRVNARIDQIPVIGSFIPSVTVPPIQRDLIDAQTFDSIRQVYSGIKLVATWGLLVGILLIVGGFFVAPRSRWYWPQAILGTAVLVLAVSIAVRRVIPAQVANAVPGGSNSGGGTFVRDFLNDNATGPIATRLLLMAIWALVLAALFAVIARMLPGWKEKYVPVKVVTAEPEAAFVAPAVLPDATVTSAAPVAEAVVVEDVVVEDVVVVEAAVPEASAIAAEPMVVESPPSAPAVKPTRAKAAPAAKAAPVKATPAKATPATKPAAASATPAPKATRTRKPAPPKE